MELRSTVGSGSGPEFFRSRNSKFKSQKNSAYNSVLTYCTYGWTGTCRTYGGAVLEAKFFLDLVSSHRIFRISVSSRLRNKLATVLLSITAVVVQGYFSRLSYIDESPFSVLADGVDSTESGRTFHCKHHVDSLPQIGFLSDSTGNNLRRLSTGKQILTSS